MWWKWLFGGVTLAWVLMVVVILIAVWRDDWKDRKAKKLAAWLDYERTSNRLDALLRNYADDKQIARNDMDILSKRITNAFEYVTTVMAAHELVFHPKATPKKPAKKNKRRTPEQIDGLIEMVRKA